MKSIIILVSLAISHVSALPLGDIFGGDLTGGLLDGDTPSGLLDGTDVLGDSGLGDLLDPNALDLDLLKRQSFGLPGGDLTGGLLDGDVLSGLLDDTDVLGDSGDITSPVGDLLDPNALDLGLLKRQSSGLLGGDFTDDLLDGDALSGLLDDTDVLGDSGDITSPVGDLLDPNALDLGLLKRQSFGLPGGDLTDGLLDGDALSGLLDGTDVLGDSGDITSPVGDLLDPNALDLGLLKRQSFGLPDGDLTDGLLDGDVLSGLLDGTDVLGDSGDITSPVGDLLDPNALDLGLAKRLLADALVKRGISILSTPGKRYILSNGIGGQTGTGVIGLAGNLQQIGAGVVAVGGAGASGHIGRDLGNGIGGQVGAGVVAAAGSLDHIGGGSLALGGLGGSGHVGR